MTIPFWKMSGSGNDFVVLDNRKGTIRGNVSRLAARLCDRHEGVGADGLLLLEKIKHRASSSTLRSSNPATPLAFRMLYYNADGSRASMCGNGARCMAYFAHAHRAVGRQFQFLTDAYPVNATVQGMRVRVSLAGASGYQKTMAARVGSKTWHAAFLNTGVPHAVVFVKDAEAVDVQGLGRALRFHALFGPKGTNVNFVQKLGPAKIRVRTYERGVEGETLACGTGVTASAIAAVLQGSVKAPVQCLTQGGDVLTVRLTPRAGHPEQVATDVSLEGPVRVTFKGEVHV